MPERPELSEFVERLHGREDIAPFYASRAIEHLRPELEELLRLRAENERLRELLHEAGRRWGFKWEEQA